MCPFPPIKLLIPHMPEALMEVRGIKEISQIKLLLLESEC